MPYVSTWQKATSPRGGKEGVVEDPANKSYGLKERLRLTLAKNRFDVTHFYKTTGFCQRMARSQRFESLTLAVITFNAIWIWIDVDYNESTTLLDAEPLFVAVEMFFCMFFGFEWCCRFGAFIRKCDCYKDGWFVFDSLLVGLMFGESFIFSFMVEAGIIDFGDELGQLSILRLLRLLRLTRIGKLMSYIPELMIMLKGMVEGMRSVSLTMVLLAVIIYVVAIALVQISRGTNMGEAYFLTVPEACYTLLIYGMLPDLAEVMTDLKQEWYIAVIFVVFVFFSTFTILNMLIGILCEVVSEVKSSEKEMMDIEWLRHTLRKVMEEEIDADHDGEVSKAEFYMILEKPRTLAALNKLGFDVVALVDLADILFEAPEEEGKLGVFERALSFDEFIAVLLQSRSTQPATQKDIRELQKYILQVCNPLVSDQKNPGKMVRKSMTASGPPKPMEPTGPLSLTPPSDAAVILQGLHELTNRMHHLEDLVVNAAPPELVERMTKLEGLVGKVVENQKLLMDRLPDPAVLKKLEHMPMQPGGFQISPSKDTSRQNQNRFPAGNQYTNRKPPLADPCRSLFCEGPTIANMPANALRGLPPVSPNYDN